MGDVEQPKRPVVSRLEGVKSSVDVSKSLFSLGRDLLIFFLLASLLLFPGFIRGRLLEAGIETADFGILRFELKKSEQDSVSVLRRLERTRQEAQKALDDLPDNRSAANPAADALRRVVGSLDRTGDRLVNTAARQRQALADVAPEPVRGWVSLNFVNVDGARARGSRGVTHSRPLRVRVESNSRSPVRTVLQIGTPVQIEEVNGNFAEIVTR